MNKLKPYCERARGRNFRVWISQHAAGLFQRMSYDWLLLMCYISMCSVQLLCADKSQTHEHSKPTTLCYVCVMKMLCYVLWFHMPWCMCVCEGVCVCVFIW